MKQKFNTFFLILITLLSYSPISFALTPIQEKEIRLSKASLLFSQSRDAQALRLLKANMEGKFHRDTFLTLARYFFKKKNFTKSFRLYQVLIKRGIGRKLAKSHYNPNLKSNFERLLIKTAEPSKEDLSITLELAERFYATYKDKTLPEEFLLTVLSLSEKYYTVTAHFNFFKGESHLNLARIDLIRDKVDSALNHLHIAQNLFSSLNKENNFRDKVLLEDIKVLLAEAYIKKGQGDVGLLLMRSLSAQPDINPAIKTYARNYLKALNASFVNAVFSYGIKSKKNINQLNSTDYKQFDTLSNRETLGKRDSLFHARRLNVFMNRQLSDKYSVSGSLDIINENSFSGEVNRPNFTNTEIALNLKRFRNNNSIILFDYQFNNLSGRELDSLQVIQPKSSHRFSFAYQWLYKKGLVNIEVPLEFSSFNTERSTNSFAVAMSYESLITDKWFAPKYYSSLGRRSEGENLDSSFFFQLGATNKSDIKYDWNIVTGFDFYTNSNNLLALNYSELNFNLISNHKLKVLTGLSINLSYELTRRSFDEPLGTINMSEFGAGLTYNF